MMLYNLIPCVIALLLLAALHIHRMRVYRRILQQLDRTIAQFTAPK